MNNKVFISGKITGDPNYPFKFESACLVVSREKFFNEHGSAELSYKYGHFGFVPVSPADLTLLDMPIGLYSWHVCMAVCLWHLMGCSYVYFLRDWQQSRGSRIEHRVAKFLRKRIIYQAPPSE